MGLAHVRMTVGVTPGRKGVRISRKSACRSCARYSHMYRGYGSQIPVPREIVEMALAGSQGASEKLRMKKWKIVFDDRNNKHLRRIDTVFAIAASVLILLFYLRSVFIAKALNISVMALKTIVVGGAIFLLCMEKIVTCFIERKLERKNSGHEMEDHAGTGFEEHPKHDQ